MLTDGHPGVYEWHLSLWDMMTDQMKVDLFSLINGVSHTEGGLMVRGIISGDFMDLELC